MKSMAILASAAVLALTLNAPAASAQGLSHAGPVMLMDHSMSTSHLIGMSVNDDAGKSFGTVVDVLVKDKGMEPTVILSVGGYVGKSEKLIAVPISHIRLKGMAASMPGTNKAMIESMPEFKYQFEGSTSG